jgi:hypothetical protein
MTISVSILLLSIAESKLIATIEEHNMEYLQEIVRDAFSILKLDLMFLLFISLLILSVEQYRDHPYLRLNQSQRVKICRPREALQKKIQVIFNIFL